MKRFCLLFTIVACLHIACVPRPTAPVGGSTTSSDSLVTEQAWQEVQDRVFAVPRLQRDLQTLLDEHIAARSEPYKSAVRTILAQQILFCDGTDRPERVEVIWKSDDTGQTVIELESPGRYDYGDTLPAAMTLRDGAVVGMTFRVDSNIDSCPCNGWENPKYLDDDLMELVSQIDTLESLELRNSNVMDDGFSHIVRLKRLETLDIWETQITASGLARLAQLDRLEKLELSSSLTEYVYPPEVCREIGRCSQLRDLHLGPTRLTVTALRGLASLRHLEALDAGALALEPAGLTAFDGHSALSKLSLGVTNAGDLEFMFPDLPNLKTLSLTIRAREVQINISDLPALEALGVTIGVAQHKAGYANPQSDSDRAELDESHVSITRLSSLNDLWLSLGRPETQQWNRDSHKLTHLPKLAGLTLSNDRGIPEIEGELPNMKMLTVFSQFQPATTFAMLPHMPNLEQIKVYRPHEQQAEQQAEQVPLSKFAPLFALKNLKVAQLANLQCDDVTSLESFLALPRLSELMLTNCQFGDQLEISGHTALEHLRFESGAPRAIIAEDLPNLQRFTVVRSDGYKSAQFICCPSLQSLWCTETPLLKQLDLLRADLREPSKLDVVLGSGRKTNDFVLLPAEDQEESAD